MKPYFSAIGLCLWLLTLLPPCTPAFAAAQDGEQGPASRRFPAKRHALVVGIGTYSHWPALSHAVDNARELSNILKQQGFEVDLLTNPGSRELKATLRQLVEGVGQVQDLSLLIYFAGLSKTISRTDGTRTGWLVPADCPQSEKNQEAFVDQAVSMAQVVELLSDMKARHVLTLLDTGLAADVLKVSAPSLNLLGAKSQQPVRQFIVAGAPDAPQPARSMFKHYLLKGLMGEADTVRDGKITGSELAVYLKQALARGTDGRQSPQYARMSLSGLPRGDFTVGSFKPESVTGRLTITTRPQDARIRVLNIKPKFEQGMALMPGEYLVEVTADHYMHWRKRIAIKAGQHRSIEVALEKAATRFTNDVGITMTLVQAGSFKMGSAMTEKNRYEDEKAHESVLPRPFYMQTTEVTLDQFAQFVRETGYTTTAEQSKQCWFSNDQGDWQASKTLNWRTAGPELATPALTDAAWPVACVSWNDAQAFVAWLSEKEGRTYRLPTEAQWEYACRAGSRGAYSTGQCLSMAHANYNGADDRSSACAVQTKTPPRTALPVASLASNTWGLYDMHGNVAEWCQDWYGRYPHQRAMAPSGPPQGAEKVVRGGHFLNSAVGCRSARRQKLRPDFSSLSIGFRVVMLP